MEILHNYLPKDLVNIVEEYAKDRTNYDKVMHELLTYRTVFDINIDNWDPHDFGLFFFQQLWMRSKRREMKIFYEFCQNYLDKGLKIINRERSEWDRHTRGIKFFRSYSM